MTVCFKYIFILLFSKHKSQLDTARIFTNCVDKSNNNRQVETDPHCNLTSPIDWKRSPLLSPVTSSNASSCTKGFETIVVNIPPSTFSSNKETRSNHQSALSESDTASSDVSRCRYCFGSESSDEADLISPCLCSGSSKYVHKSCLEKWLTLRNMSECEVCKTKYETKWIRRPLFSVSHTFVFFNLFI